MLISNAKHSLDEKGAIGPQTGPGRKLAEFLGAVIASASYRGPLSRPIAPCRKCRSLVVAEIANDGVIAWQCTKCEEAGTISEWQGTLWDLSDAPGSSQ